MGQSYIYMCVYECVSVCACGKVDKSNSYIEFSSNISLIIQRRTSTD